MAMKDGPNELLHSLIELRSSDAKRRFRKGIFEDYPLRGASGNCACAYCGKSDEKLTIDHIVPKSKGGPYFARWNNSPSCLFCNADKGSSPLFEWWRPKSFWTLERELILVDWIQANSMEATNWDHSQWVERSHNIPHPLSIDQLKKREHLAPLPITLCAA